MSGFSKGSLTHQNSDAIQISKNYLIDGFKKEQMLIGSPIYRVNQNSNKFYLYAISSAQIDALTVIKD